MSAKSEKILRDFTQALTKPKGTTPYDTTAKVLRVENGIAWVHIAGGVDETPVKMTIDAKAGDTVQVRVSGGRAFLVGNATAPPTDDAEALIAKAKAEIADEVAKKADTKATEAKEIAVNAQQEVEEVSQYFWYKNGTGSEAGAHITEVPQETFESSPAGGNLLMKSAGIYIRQALNKLAEFTNSGLAFFARDGQKVFEIATEGTQTTGRIECVCTPRLALKNETTTIRAPRTAYAQDGVQVIFSGNFVGSSSNSILYFTKGTAQTQTITSGNYQLASVAYDGNYTFTMTIGNYSYNSNFQTIRVRYDKTWYNTTEKLLGNAYIDGNTDVYDDLKVGGTTTLFGTAMLGETIVDGAMVANGTINANGQSYFNDVSYFYDDAFFKENAEFDKEVTFKTPADVFVVEQHTTATLTGNGNYDNQILGITKAGYYPVGVVGFQQSGTLSSFLHVFAMFIKNPTVGSGEVSYNRRVIGYSGSSTLSTTVTFYVLWVKAE